MPDLLEPGDPRPGRVPVRVVQAVVCKCGAGSEGFRYARHLPQGSGTWVCGRCQNVVHPNPHQGDFSTVEMKRLDTLRALHSNDGWGTTWRREAIIGCDLDPAA